MTTTSRLVTILCLLLLWAVPGWPADSDRAAQLILLRESKWLSGEMTISPGGQIGGRAACNSFGGSYTADESHIKLSYSVTRMDCAARELEKERAFFAELRRVWNWEIFAPPGAGFQHLILTDEKGESLFMLFRVD